MLPEAFLQQMQALLGEDRLASYLSAFAEEPPVSIRINPLKLISNEQLVMSNYDYTCS
jgi:16S rRNA C967 or C1407 C5-methylase (RsmB/RsmF family)